MADDRSAEIDGGLELLRGEGREGRRELRAAARATEPAGARGGPRGGVAVQRHRRAVRPGQRPASQPHTRTGLTLHDIAQLEVAAKRVVLVVLTIDDHDGVAQSADEWKGRQVLLMPAVAQIDAPAAA